jgi:hypothetical protein
LRPFEGIGVRSRNLLGIRRVQGCACRLCSAPELTDEAKREADRTLAQKLLEMLERPRSP